MNRRTLCILLVLVACFSLGFAFSSKEEEDQYKKRLDEEKKIGKEAGTGAESSAGITTPESKQDKKPESGKPDESSTPAKGAAVTDSFFTIGALTMAAVYIV